MPEDSFEIFLSYRRDDFSGSARHLCDILRSRFGEDQVFMDVTTIEPGLDFIEAISRAIDRCDVFLPIIGRQWISIEDAKGRRRLDSETDPVRLETETALARSGLRIVPILVDGASMPSAEEMPEELARLSTRTAHELSHSRWPYDVDQLMALLEKVRGQIAAGQPTPANPNPSTLLVPREGGGHQRNKTRMSTWDEYEQFTNHSPAAMKLVRELADQVSAATDWQETRTTNQVIYRDNGRVVLALQFWQAADVRVTLGSMDGRPENDPLPQYPGFMGKNKYWSWYLPVGKEAPDISGAIEMARTQR